MKNPPPGAPSDEDSIRSRRGEHAHPSPGAAPALFEGSAKQSPGPELLAALAEKIQGARERRKAFMGSDEVSETGWEMLIALFRSDGAMHRMTVTNLCEASHAPATTALRWLDRLEELGLVRRHASEFDGRIIFVELEPRARSAIHAYLTEIWVTLYGAD